jgi:hypothetical protein
MGGDLRVVGGEWKVRIQTIGEYHNASEIRA